jgi:hypothetical protein
MEVLILVATLGGPTVLARIGVMRALNRHACDTDATRASKDAMHYGQSWAVATVCPWIDLALLANVANLEIRRVPETPERLDLLSLTQRSLQDRELFAAGRQSKTILGAARGLGDFQ